MVQGRFAGWWVGVRGGEDLCLPDVLSRSWDNGGPAIASDRSLRLKVLGPGTRAGNRLCRVPLAANDALGAKAEGALAVLPNKRQARGGARIPRGSAGPANFVIAAAHLSQPASASARLRSPSTSAKPSAPSTRLPHTPTRPSPSPPTCSLSVAIQTHRRKHVYPRSCPAAHLSAR